VIVAIVIKNVRVRVILSHKILPVILCGQLMCYLCIRKLSEKTSVKQCT